MMNVWQNQPEELIPEEPEELLGKRVDFVVMINSALGLPAGFCSDVFAEYQLEGQNPV